MSVFYLEAFSVFRICDILLLDIPSRYSSDSIYSCLFLSCSVLEKKLKEREEKEQQLIEAKTKLENEIAEIMKSSGDSSAQLSKMNDNLRSKEK